MMDIIFWNFLILYQFFFSPKVKRSVIISNKYGIYEPPHELQNDDIFADGRAWVPTQEKKEKKDLGSEEINKNQENLKTS